MSSLDIFWLDQFSFKTYNQLFSTMFQVDCSLSECKAKKEASLMEREQVSEPVSAMERERTMRNLVDMQRKVEQRQQRDRERQLLRVRQGVERDTACS